MDSIVSIKIYHNGKLLSEQIEHNLITDYGDIYYSKKVTGEDTSSEFPNFFLELGEHPEYELVDPDKDYNGTVKPVMSVPLIEQYTEPITSMVYRFHFKGVPPEHQNKVIWQLAIVNGLTGVDKKAINVLNLKSPMKLVDDLDYYILVKHTVHYPGTEDNKWFHRKLLYNSDIETMFLDLPDLKVNENNIYIVKEEPSRITEKFSTETINYPEELTKDRIVYTVYKSLCSGADYGCTDRQNSVWACADTDLILKQGFTDNIKDLSNYNHDSFVSYSCFFEPKESGVYRFISTGGFAQDVIIEGKLFMPNKTGKDSENDFYEYGYVPMKKGQKYSFVCNYVHKKGNKFQLYFIPPSQDNVDNFKLPFNLKELLNYASVYTYNDDRLSKINRKTIFVLKYGLIENFIGQRKHYIFNEAEKNRYLIQIYKPEANRLIPFTLPEGLKNKTFSIIKINTYDIYYRSTIKLIDGGMAFQTTHIYSVNFRFKAYQEFTCRNHNTTFYYFKINTLKGNFVKNCHNTHIRNINFTFSVKNICGNGLHIYDTSLDNEVKTICGNALRAYNIDYQEESKLLCVTEILNLKPPFKIIMVPVDEQYSEPICLRRTIRYQGIFINYYGVCYRKSVYCKNIKVNILKNCVYKNTVKIYKLFHNCEGITCLIGPYTRIYTIHTNIEYIICFLNFTNIYSIFKNKRKYYEDVCAKDYTYIKEIPVNPTAGNMNNCAEPSYIRNTDIDWRISKGFCAKLIMPPPPGTGP